MRTEAIGAGDLRPYALVQFLPMLLMPLMLLLWQARAVARVPLWTGLGAYAPRSSRSIRRAIYTATGFVSGHA